MCGFSIWGKRPHCHWSRFTSRAGRLAGLKTKVDVTPKYCGLSSTQASQPAAPPELIMIICRCFARFWTKVRCAYLLSISMQTDKKHFTSAVPRGFWTPPQVFRRYSPPFLAHLGCSYVISTHVVKISDPGHLKSSDLTSEKVWMFAIASSNDRSVITLKLSPIDIRTSIYKMYLSEFHIGDPRSGQSWDLPIRYKSIGENWKAPLLDESHSKHSQTSVYRYTCHSESEYCNQWPSPHVAKVISGHERSPEVFRQ